MEGGATCESTKFGAPLPFENKAFQARHVREFGQIAFGLQNEVFDTLTREAPPRPRDSRQVPKVLALIHTVALLLLEYDTQEFFGQFCRCALKLED